MSHSYKTLYNNPTERMKVFYPWCYWDNAFNEDELKKMCDFFEKEGVERGTTVGSKKEDANGNITVSQAPNEEVRKSNVKFHNYNENTAWIYNRLNFVIESINNQFYNFDLNGYDTFQYTEYDDHELGKYDFHQDTIMGQNIPSDMIETRKLSMTFLLNEPGVDFEGGDFQVNTGQEKDAETVELKKGRIILFPSFVIHRVAPVTKGKRKSLVIWILGPKFR